MFFELSKDSSAVDASSSSDIAYYQVRWFVGERIGCCNTASARSADDLIEILSHSDKVSGVSVVAYESDWPF